MKNLNRIKGMKKVLESLPDEYRYWHIFGTILKLEYEKSFDYELWKDIYNIKLLVTDSNNRFEISLFLKNVTGEISFSVAGTLSGLAVDDLKSRGYEDNTSFFLYDFENEDLSIYCQDIEVELLKNREASGL